MAFPPPAVLIFYTRVIILIHAILGTYALGVAFFAALFAGDALDNPKLSIIMSGLRGKSEARIKGLSPVNTGISPFYDITILF